MRRFLLSLLPILVAIVVLLVAVRLLQRDDDAPGADAPGAEVTSEGAAPSPSGASAGRADGDGALELEKYAGSASCQPCHEAAYDAWKASHHAVAERAFDPERDREAFDPPREFTHGTQTSVARVEGDRFVLETLGFDGRREAYPLERVFGVRPLYQFLVDAGGGRLQATEAAWDPAKKQWFNVYGDEDRRPGEWGHWTGRGMNWNSMCATCHNTRVLRGYDEKTDTYTTTMAEMGVGCEACHGPLVDHVAWQNDKPDESRKDPSLLRLSKGEVLPLCGTCHARRAELTGNFLPRDGFLDHFILTIPDDTDTYFPDGQVRDENFEFASFLSSRMHNEGVRCVDCHEPHSVKTKFTGNALCLQCHKNKIDPGPHSHHEPDTPGGRCVDCHMPLTTYMQRHERRDHGFTIPDPQMTIDYGIPNACNRCHTDRDTEWALEAVKGWYGDRMERITRKRTRAIAEARRGETAGLESLLLQCVDEKHFFWRAVMAGLLRFWPEDGRVQRLLLQMTRDEHELVRGVAAHALDHVVPLGLDSVDRALRRLLDDPVRSVRVEAAWSLRRTLDPGSRAGKDLWTMLRLGADQPVGAMRLAVYHLDRGMPSAAEQYFARAVAWDGNSPPLRQGYAVALSILDRHAEAARQLEAACRLEPRDAGFRFNLALAYSAAARLDLASEAFEAAVQLEPAFTRAWYNLGLARSKLGDLGGALSALERAESIDATSPDYPYARATVLSQMGRVGEARQAAERALSLQPDYTPAQQLLDLLDFEGE